MPLSTGDRAPDLALVDQHGRTVRLSDLLRDKAVLVVFYPWAFSGICGGELHELQAVLGELTGDGLEVVTVSTDSMFALRTFADREGFTFPMLADFWPHGAVAEAYGVLEPDVGVALRATFLVGTDGTVRWSVLKGIGDARDVADYRKAVADL
jgi:peroxiredoxin